ncbi:translation elongation factor 4 [Pectobacterium brasiliense]|uniref:translation elongation factor 4 n=1 Tax=Pectobacterium brasiliense TaxID=180957 RepID=UPI001CE08758|nr:translation elongation factor 4 [Pectobacterium brasiliense]MCA5919311.1 translation elongation factor 4 [Pectobacterium brasiliense]MCA5926302.1 translation elongation factor 4 [Pectobacterium brasiliense]MCA5935682.1 translation elongation factor 4 [Pectobacterium brasiliense]MCA5941613.1 translation elongation factor 4 [Pectobacterium brasiliense]MCA5943295.1 translation elongation factor 4 [Pectobacterium brasiliense]
MCTPQIRNFCIIAHVDHGKSTLADRFIELTATVAQRDMRELLLDSMEIERERGITIKLQTVRMSYRDENGQRYQFNLVDTPGHVDFSAEVSRSLAACDGAILLIDATQGVQAQTIANLNLARQQGLTILPVLNKIDSPQANVPQVMQQLAAIPSLDISTVLTVSAKTGEGVAEVLDAIAHHFPAPTGLADAPLRALVFDSHYDPYQGAIMHVRVVDGSIQAGATLRFMSSGTRFEVTETGAFFPHRQPCTALENGEVGYLAAGLKDAAAIRVGDTLTSAERPATEPVARYQDMKPMVFSGLYPDADDDLKGLRNAMNKLSLNDAALHWIPDVSASLGAGFRCGFLGMLHMDIVRERLRREYGISVIATAPSVEYRVTLHNGQCLTIDNPAHFPGEDVLHFVEEPYVICTINTPDAYVGTLMEYCASRRGEFIDMQYLDNGSVTLHWDLPLNEMIFGFFDALKSLTQGYATLDYEPGHYRRSDLVRCDIYLDSQLIDAFSFIIARHKAWARATEIVKALKYVIPRKLYPVPAQAKIGNRVIAREDIPPLRKSALAQGFQGSLSQKQRLIRKQRENKKHNVGFSKRDIPREAFMAVLAIDA